MERKDERRGSVTGLFGLLDGSLLDCGPLRKRTLFGVGFACSLSFSIGFVMVSSGLSTCMKTTLVSGNHSQYEATTCLG